MIDVSVRRHGSLSPFWRRAVCAASLGLLVTSACSSQTHNAASSPTGATAPGVRWIPGGGALVALDSKTGRRLWRASLPMASVGGPIVSRGLVIVGGANDCHARQVTVAAVAAQTGQLVWQSSIANDDPCRFNVSLAGGVVVVGGAYEDPPYAHAVSCGQKTPGTPAVALDVTTGKRRWQAPLATSAVLAATSKYVIVNGPSPNCVVGLDARSGQSRWTVDTKGPSLFGWANSDTAYVLTLFPTRQLFGAIDPATGRSRWSVPLPIGGSLISVAIGDAIIIANPPDRTPPHAIALTGLDPSSGRELWRDHSQQQVFEDDSLAATGNALLVTHNYENRFSLDLRDARTGARRWQSPQKNGYVAGGSPTDGDVVIATWDKEVAGISAADGRQLWDVHGTFDGATLHGTSTYLTASGKVKNEPTGD